MNKLSASREIRLASRARGIPIAANFTLAETTLPPLQDHQVLVRNLFMSVDPYMRGRTTGETARLPRDWLSRVYGESEESAGGMWI